MIDRGDLAVVRAVPDDPITYYRGRFQGSGLSTAAMRQQERADEARAERAKERRVTK